jgi:hypothetical protein
MSVLRFMSLVILAVWIGGLAVIGIVAAPSVFAVLEAHDPVGGRTLAATVFGAVFMRFQPITWGLGGLLIVLFAIRAALGPRPGKLAVRIWTVLAMVGMSVVTTFVIAPRIDRIRNATPGPIASLASTDARKVEFDRWHGLSNGLMLLTLVGGLGLIWFETHDTH